MKYFLIKFLESDTYIQSLLMVSQIIQQNPKLRKYQEQDPEYASKLARLVSHMNTDPAVLQQILTDPVTIIVIINYLEPRFERWLNGLYGYESKYRKEGRQY